MKIIGSANKSYITETQMALFQNVRQYTLFFLTSLGLSIMSFSQARNLNLEVTQLSEHAYLLTRTWKPSVQRTNMGVVIGEKGLVLINALYSDEELELFEKELQKLSDKPVKYVINSNWDAYNTWSNQYFKEMGAVIISHENLAYHDGYNADINFNDKFSLNVGTETITAYRSYGHSFGHINVHLENANTTFMSDSYRSEWMTMEGPFGLEGHFKGLDMALAMGNEFTKYISGNTHSKIVSSREDLLNEKQLRSAFAERVLSLKKEGKSVNEILSDGEIVAICKQYELYSDLVANGEIGDWMINPILFGEQAKTHGFSIEQLEKYVGNYQVKDKNDIEIFIENGELFAKSPGQFYLKLVPVSESKFWHNMQHLKDHLTFDVDDNDHVIGFLFQHNGGSLRYNKH
ncbi:hypothetical protein [Fulvivirga sp.]|uniref:hypothetical protein n=1 Tax=Fulvivirga sp. TaxID=1931237 RepID=UPI0032EE3C9D